MRGSNLNALHARRVCELLVQAVQLFHELVYDAINVDVIHAERSAAQRDATVDKFRSGKVARQSVEVQCNGKPNGEA